MALVGWNLAPTCAKPCGTTLQVHLWNLGCRLERHVDGRRSWAFGSGGDGQVPDIGELLVDRGRLIYLAPSQGRVAGPQHARIGPLGHAALPATQAYSIKGHLQKTGEIWRMNAFEGALGRSAIGGNLVFDRSGVRPLLKGSVQSRQLDFDDLGPLIGVSPAGPSGAAAAANPKSSRRIGKVLPASPMDFGRLAKDPSIFSVRSPIRIGGTLAAPQAGPDKSALAGRAGLAIALGVINPLLALAATAETGPGVDANCSQALETARKSGAEAAGIGAAGTPEVPRSKAAQKIRDPQAR